MRYRCLDVSLGFFPCLGLVLILVSDTKYEDSIPFISVTWAVRILAMNHWMSCRRDRLQPFHPRHRRVHVKKTRHICFNSTPSVSSPRQPLMLLQNRLYLF